MNGSESQVAEMAAAVISISGIPTQTRLWIISVVNLLVRQIATWLNFCCEIIWTSGSISAGLFLLINSVRLISPAFIPDCKDPFQESYFTRIDFLGYPKPWNETPAKFHYGESSIDVSTLTPFYTTRLFPLYCRWL